MTILHQINQPYNGIMGGSPGLVVMGGDSRSEGRGFESRCHILDGHFFTLICCKIVLIFVCKRPKINEKEAGLAHFNIMASKSRLLQIPKKCANFFQYFSNNNQCKFPFPYWPWEKIKFLLFAKIFQVCNFVNVFH